MASSNRALKIRALLRLDDQFFEVDGLQATIQFLRNRSVKVIELTNANLKKETKSGVVVIDCHATWCQPCKAMAAPFKKMAEKFPDAKFVKLDTDEVECDDYDIQSVPTFIVLKDGKEIDRFVGGTSPKNFEAWLRGALE